MTPEFADDLTELFKSVDEPMVETRRDLHAHPELAFNEHYTTRVINDRLVALGWELAPCPTQTRA
jgi:metal-dependent amidase/aminoacylase/carboxypeptidase family protein